MANSAEMGSGKVVSEPDEGQFLLLTNPETGAETAVQLQDGTLFFDPLGQLGPEAVVLGADLDIEGAFDADLLRAALVFVSPPADDQLSGSISAIAEDGTNFTLTTDSGDFTVTLTEDAYILLVNVTDSEVTMGTFEDLYVGQVVDVFGTDISTETESLFEANEVIVDVNASPPPP